MEEIANEVMIAGQTASLLEVSAYPKPGNVHRMRDFSDMRYEHFLVGAVSLGPALRGAAIEGVRGKEIELGKYIKMGVSEIGKHHLGGNTHLGICLLLIPLAAAGGKTMAQSKVELKALRENLSSILSSTTPQDSVDVYDAIKTCGKWLGSSRAFDLSDGSTRARLKKEGINLKEWMAISDWDTVAKQLTTGMEISFDIGYPSFRKNLRYKDINVATVHTYLKILSEIPDTFIARKVGLKRTSEIDEAVKIGKKETGWVSEEARSILELGGLTTKEGKKKLYQFDEALHKKGLNPGTTADLTASSLMIALLLGLRF